MPSSIAPPEPRVAAPHGGQRMNIVIVGHVDHGKSTVIGRLLADTHSLPDGKLEQIRAQCELNSKPFEYAFLLDALKDEQAQGITIDAARVFFKSQRRPYLILDAPGHIEFLKNMITGAARAEAALLVIDAAEGVQENSRRHGYMVSLLGIRQLAVVVNKMDLVGWDRRVYDRDRSRSTARSSTRSASGRRPSSRSPARGGDNIADRSPELCPGTRARPCSTRSTRFGASRPRSSARSACRSRTSTSSPSRAMTGASWPGRSTPGTVSVGDAVIFYPSGKKSRVKSIEGFNRPTQRRAEAGWAVGFTLHEQIYIHAWRDGGARGRAPPAGDDPAPGQPVLARQGSDGEAQGVPAQARHGPGHGPGRGGAAGDGRVDARRHRAAQCRRATRRGRVRAQARPRHRVRPGGGGRRPPAGS